MRSTFHGDRFIGDWTNTSGSYLDRGLPGLSKRNGGGNGPELYKFEPFFDTGGYYITHPTVIQEIGTRLGEMTAAETKDEWQEYADELTGYLYREIADNFGIMTIIEGALYQVEHAREEGKRDGKAAAQKLMRTALGISR